MGTEQDWIKRVKSLMSEKKITQQDLVAVLGVSTRGAVGHYLTGRTQPNIKQFQALADYLGVSINYIVSGENKDVSINKAKLKQCIAVVNKVIDKNNIELSEDQQSRLVAYLYSETSDKEEISEEKTFDLIGIFV